VGTIAAQSIGQPGTQLTMRTFHIGGAATTVSEDNRSYLKYPVYIKDVAGPHVESPEGNWLFTRKGQITVNKIMKEFSLEAGDELVAEDGKRVNRGAPVIRRRGEEIASPEHAYAMVLDREGGRSLYLIGQDQKLDIRNGSTLVVKKGDVVEKEKTLATFDPFSEPIIAEASGEVRYEDILEGSTLKEEFDEETGNTEKRITEFQMENKQPRIVIVDEEGTEKQVYHLPAGAVLGVDHGEQISAGKIIAKTLKESARAGDITSGLPRVSELFEARKPKSPTVLALVSGIVDFGKGVLKGKRVILVRDDFGKEFKHLVPMTKRILVRHGDHVEAGEKLCDGNENPHDILYIKGESQLQRYLMDEIQQVYRLQGVSINDKHIGVIIRQMMRKVEIVAVGDTKFIFGQMVDKYRFHDDNRQVVDQGGQPAVAKPMFQGITKASLNIDSFLSAASFQETTKVLTNAAIAGSTDNLRGLKENIIIGHPIPAGTGMKRYKEVKLFDAESEDLDAKMQEILEQRKLEKAAAEEEEEEYVQEELDD
jgi:DNA-directed RNA polymerase subunit beta'